MQVSFFFFFIFVGRRNRLYMKTEYEKCMAGEPFVGSEDPKIVEMILRTKRLLVQFNATDYADTERRQELLHEMFGSMGKACMRILTFIASVGSIFSWAIRR